VLVTGIAGGLSRRVAERLREKGHTVVGVDYRPVPPLPPSLEGMKVHQASYQKTAIEDVFRYHKFDAVLHLGREGNLTKRAGARFDINVVGSQKILNLAVSHGLKSVVVMSTFHVYGAQPTNPTPIGEDDPLRAGYDFPEIADAIQMDSLASTTVFKYPELRTVVLRPTNLVGPNLQNTMSKFLRLPRIPYLAGFNPMMQFLHEDDMASAVLAAFEGNGRGVFNVAGPTVLPWRTALEILGANIIPVPASLAGFYLRTFSPFPEYLLKFFKYPCVISDAAFRKTFGWAPSVSIQETLRSTLEGPFKRVAKGRQAKTATPGKVAGEPRHSVN
jgi:UDP-glucose 4-epimerase